MIKQSLANNDSILSKKFKILRTSIMLGNIKDRDAVLKEYEETAYEIDKIKRGVYEELLASKMYTTTSLEEERDRLRDLVSFIEKRINERNEFVDDYIKITANFLDDLPRVSMESELASYRLRLDNIDEYLNNCIEIDELNKKIKKLRDELEEKYESKANNELINSKLEDELIDEFNKFISKEEYYSNLNYPDIDLELNRIDSIINEKKDVMETFNSSYEALKNAGISGAEREEYLSYVQDSRIDYYSELEKKFILSIYKLILDKESDYDKLYEKRVEIERILNKRIEARTELEIKTRDEMEYFTNLCKEQFSVIKAQKYNIESIDKLILEINNCENRLERLEEDNNKEEIKSLLEEYSCVAPEVEKITLPQEKEVYKEVITKMPDGSTRPKNMVVKISEPVKLNVKTASDTAKLVMKKVVIVLEPKKFSGKRDKLKEAEIELEERRRKEKLLKEEKYLEEKQEPKEEPLFEDLSDGLDEFNNPVKESIFEEEDNITDDNIFEDFNNNNQEDINITLATKEVKDKDILNTIEEDNIKINIDNSSQIPTEIYIEEPKEEVLDLFKSTDPFLDDNDDEIRNKNSNITEDSKMPQITNIGTVRPNNMLSKIENVVKENDDIILPTMGLTDNDSKNVPIVSENYIN